MTVFPSIHHPGDAALAFVLARAQVQPVALALIALLTVSCVALLEGEPVLSTLAWSSPLAYVVAVGWTLYELHRKPAEVVVRGGFAAVRSVWDVARRQNPASDAELLFYRVFPPQRVDGELTVAIGHDVHTIRREEWPTFDALKEALHAASMSFAPPPK